MKRANKHLTVLFAIWVLLSGCDPYGENDYQEYAVVETHLIAERQLPEVILTTTLPLDQPYRFEDAAISQATVVIHLLDDDGETAQQTFTYRMATPGIYVPIFASSHVVEPRRTYKLEANVPGHGTLTGKTTVPDTFRVISPVPEEVVYQQETLRITISNTVRQGRQNVYSFQAIASDPVMDNLTPFYRSLIEDDLNELEDFENNPSNTINEANFEVADDGSIQLQFPWLGAAFFGENRIAANSLDRNMVDFLNSQDAQSGGSTLPPG
jgi:hypothetical protein